jgi:hypothetical protein
MLHHTSYGISGADPLIPLIATELTRFIKVISKKRGVWRWLIIMTSSGIFSMGLALYRGLLHDFPLVVGLDILDIARI